MERLDAISRMLNRPVEGGVADLSGNGLRGVTVPLKSTASAYDPSRQFSTPRAHYTHQLECFYHHVLVEAPPHFVREGLFEEKVSNIPLLLSEFLGDEEGLFRLLKIKYACPHYNRFVHFA